MGLVVKNVCTDCCLQQVIGLVVKNGQEKSLKPVYNSVTRQLVGGVVVQVLVVAAVFRGGAGHLHLRVSLVVVGHSAIALAFHR